MPRAPGTVPPAEFRFHPRSFCAIVSRMKCPCARILWYWLPPILWPVLFRVALLLVHSGQVPRWVAGHDKLLHMLYFAIMAVLVWRGFRFERRLAPWPAAWAAFALVAVYGGIDEFTQQFRSHRSADIHDWFADLAGASVLFVITAAGIFMQRRRPADVPLACPES